MSAKKLQDLLNDIEVAVLKIGLLIGLVIFVGKYLVHEGFAWGTEFYFAAKELGWETLLIEWVLKSSG